MWKWHDTRGVGRRARAASLATRQPGGDGGWAIGRGWVLITHGRSSGPRASGPIRLLLEGHARPVAVSPRIPTRTNPTPIIRTSRYADYWIHPAVVKAEGARGRPVWPLLAI